MPFIGSAGAPGDAQVAMEQASRPQVLTIGPSAQGLTKPLNCTGLGRVTMILTQISGELGVARLEYKLRGNTPTVDDTPIPIATLNVPIHIDVPLGARDVALRWFSGPNGPATIQTALMLTAAS